MRKKVAPGELPSHGMPREPISVRLASTCRFQLAQLRLCWSFLANPAIYPLACRMPCDGVSGMRCAVPQPWLNASAIASYSYYGPFSCPFFSKCEMPQSFHTINSVGCDFLAGRCAPGGRLTDNL